MKTVSPLLPQAQDASGSLEVANPCAACAVRPLAVCSSLTNAELVDLSKVSRHRTLQAGDSLFFEGDEADGYHIIQSGAVKLYKLLEDGRRQIVGFMFKGDLVGQAYQEHHNFTVEALGPTELCHLPKEKFELLIADSGPFSRRLLTLASAGAAAAENQMLLLGRKSALERLASFLLWLSDRARERGEDPARIDVPMSRTDMGDYLGLTVETVSRTVTKLKKAGTIALPDRPIIEITDLPGLTAAAGA